MYTTVVVTEHGLGGFRCRDLFYIFGELLGLCGTPSPGGSDGSDWFESEEGAREPVWLKRTVKLGVCVFI